MSVAVAVCGKECLYRIFSTKFHTCVLSNYANLGFYILIVWKDVYAKGGALMIFFSHTMLYGKMAEGLAENDWREVINKFTARVVELVNKNPPHTKLDNHTLVPASTAANVFQAEKSTAYKAAVVKAFKTPTYFCEAFLEQRKLQKYGKSSYLYC